jgi:hypothetical protein
MAITNTTAVGFARTTQAAFDDLILNDELVEGTFYVLSGGGMRLATGTDTYDAITDIRVVTATPTPSAELIGRPIINTTTKEVLCTFDGQSWTVINDGNTQRVFFVSQLSIPQTAEPDAIYVNTTDNTMHICTDGSNWVQLGGGTDSGLKWEVVS